MSEQKHIKNHYVPELYLQNWTINGEINVYNNLVSHENVPLFQKKNISGICYMNHLYTNHVEQTDYDDFEHWINNTVEIPYKATQDKILNGIKLKYDDYQNLSRFVFAQYFRVPKFYAVKYSGLVNGIENSFEDMLNDILNKAERKIKYKIPLEQPKLPKTIGEIPINTNHEKIGEQDYLQVETLFGRKSWISTMQRMIEESLDKIKDYKWQIIRSIDGYEWYTSDNPVTLLNYWSKDKYNFNGAWKVKHTTVFMPISPKCLLLTEVGVRKPFINNVDMQNFFNRCIIENSFLQVFSTKPDKSICQVRPRTVDVKEYNRIQNMLTNWHDDQSEEEDEFCHKKLSKQN